MQAHDIPQKTERGRQAMITRPPELLPRLRSMLILVDGKRPVAELEKLGAGMADPRQSLQTLLDAGWIEMPGAAALMAPKTLKPAPHPLEVAGPPSGLPGTVLPLPDARRRMVRFINDQLGPMGESLAMRVEASKSVTELRGLVPKVRDHLRNYKGSEAVHLFDEEVLPLIPTVP